VTLDKSEKRLGYSKAGKYTVYTTNLTFDKFKHSFVIFGTNHPDTSYVYTANVFSETPE